MLNPITTFVMYEKLKLENHFYEMITATVSHDMRTPINAITGLATSLEDFISDSRGKTMLSIVKNSSSILLSLVNDLLDFFVLKNGKFKPNQEKANPALIIKELVEMF